MRIPHYTFGRHASYIQMRGLPMWDPYGIVTYEIVDPYGIAWRNGTTIGGYCIARYFHSISGMWRLMSSDIPAARVFIWAAVRTFSWNM